MSAKGRLGESGRPTNVLRLRYMAQYGVSKYVIKAIGLENLVRMTPLARAVIFSTGRWEHQHRKISYTGKHPGKMGMKTKLSYARWDLTRQYKGRKAA